MLSIRSIVYRSLIIFFFLIVFQDQSVAGGENDLSLKTVVLDPGHGGMDPGANVGTVYEKDLVLSIALKAGQLIRKKHPEVNVVFTREKDVFVPLSQRAEIANKARADLFISVHLNFCSSPSVAGAETYILGQHRTEENLEVAKLENSVILLEDDYTTRYEGFDPNSVESYIMFEVIQNEFLEHSRLFAEKLQHTLVNLARRPDRGVRQAGFLVIRRTSMPSVLVELGFMSNRDELKYVQTAKGQADLAHSVLDAFTEFKTRYDERARIVAETEAHNKADTVKITRQRVQSDSLVDLSRSSGTLYGIQVLAIKDRLPVTDARFRSETPVCYLVENGLYKYIVGVSSDKFVVDRALSSQRKKFTDCFPVKIENGAKVPYR